MKLKNKLINLRKIDIDQKIPDSDSNLTYRDIYGDFAGGYNLFSYGAIPQTFERKKETSIKEYLVEEDKNDDKLNGEYVGDGDPIDICLIDHHGKTRQIGDV